MGTPITNIILWDRSPPGASLPSNRLHSTQRSGCYPAKVRAVPCHHWSSFKINLTDACMQLGG